MLEVADNLQRCQQSTLAHLRDTTSTETEGASSAGEENQLKVIAEGVRMTNQSLLSALEANGVLPIPAEVAIVCFFRISITTLTLNSRLVCAPVFPNKTGWKPF
jgi:hypothetical protein